MYDYEYYTHMKHRCANFYDFWNIHLRKLNPKLLQGKTS